MPAKMGTMRQDCVVTGRYTIHVDDHMSFMYICVLILLEYTDTLMFTLSLLSSFPFHTDRLQVLHPVIS